MEVLDAILLSSLAIQYSVSTVMFVISRLISGSLSHSLAPFPMSLHALAASFSVRVPLGMLYSLTLPFVAGVGFVGYQSSSVAIGFMVPS